MKQITQRSLRCGGFVHQGTVTFAQRPEAAGHGGTWQKLHVEKKEQRPWGRACSEKNGVWSRQAG